MLFKSRSLCSFANMSLVYLTLSTSASRPACTTEITSNSFLPLRIHSFGILRMIAIKILSSSLSRDSLAVVSKFNN